MKCFLACPTPELRGLTGMFTSIHDCGSSHARWMSSRFAVVTAYQLPPGTCTLCLGESNLYFAHVPSSRSSSYSDLLSRKRIFEHSEPKPKTTLHQQNSLGEGGGGTSSRGCSLSENKKSTMAAHRRRENPQDKVSRQKMREQSRRIIKFEEEKHKYTRCREKNGYTGGNTKDKVNSSEIPNIRHTTP